MAQLQCASCVSMKAGVGIPRTHVKYQALLYTPVTSALGGRIPGAHRAASRHS